MNTSIGRCCVFLWGGISVRGESVMLRVPYVAYGMVPQKKEMIGCQDEIKVKVARMLIFGAKISKSCLTFFPDWPFLNHGRS